MWMSFCPILQATSFFYAQAKDGFVERGRAVHAAAREAALYGS